MLNKSAPAANHMVKRKVTAMTGHIFNLEGELNSNNIDRSYRLL
jgi:hypothetical protein